MKLITLAASASLFIATCAFAQQAEQNTAPTSNSTKLYALDCGTIAVSDMNDLSANGEFSGQQTELANPCFLIRHPKGDLLWDTGLIDQLADIPDGEKSGVWHSKLSVKLLDQLKQLALSPLDIEYLALSHLHPDHSGNANKFSGSTFIISKLEHDFMFSTEMKSLFGEVYSELEDAKTITFNDNYDVFADGSVVIKTMPGHTPGSSILQLDLANAGVVLFTGDLYVHAKGRALNTMHKYNFDKNITLDSRKKFEALAKQTQAKIIIQHERNDVESLPKFPEFLD